MSSTLVGLPFGLSAVWRWAWVDTGDYLGGRFDVGRALLVCGLVVAVVLVLEAPTVLLVWAQRSRLRQVDPVVGLWLTGAVIAALPGFRFVVHYFQLLVPPLALLGGVLLSGTGDRPRRILLVSAGGIAVLCMATAWMPFADARQVKPDLVQAIQQHSGRSDRILVWGALPEAYWRTGRLPAARFLSVGYMTGR